MRHLFLAESDYAACGSAFSLSLQAVGETVRYICSREHLYQYPHQKVEKATLEHAFFAQAVEWADWIWVVQSDLPSVMGGTYGSPCPSDRRDKWIERFTDKRVALLHGGGHFRDNREMYQAVWSGCDPLSLCYEADLMGSFKDEHLVIPPLDPSWMPSVKRQWGALRVGHFPSRPTDKGSEWMVPWLSSQAGIEFRTSVTNAKDEEGVDRVPWPQQLARMAQCDVVVDQIKPELGGRVFGEWVSIATETAMMGRIPIANSLNPQPYRDTYGCEPPVHICNDAVALTAEINRLAGLSSAQIVEEQEECGRIARENHSLKATGDLLMRLME